MTFQVTDKYQISMFCSERLHVLGGWGSIFFFKKKNTCFYKIVGKSLRLYSLFADQNVSTTGTVSSLRESLAKFCASDNKIYDGITLGL